MENSVWCARMRNLCLSLPFAFVSASHWPRWIYEFQIKCINSFWVKELWTKWLDSVVWIDFHFAIEWWCNRVATLPPERRKQFVCGPVSILLPKYEHLILKTPSRKGESKLLNCHSSPSFLLLFAFNDAFTGNEFKKFLFSHSLRWLYNFHRCSSAGIPYRRAHLVKCQLSQPFVFFFHQNFCDDGNGNMSAVGARYTRGKFVLCSSRRRGLCGILSELWFDYACRLCTICHQMESNFILLFASHCFAVWMVVELIELFALMAMIIQYQFGGIVSSQINCVH